MTFNDLIFNNLITIPTSITVVQLIELDDNQFNQHFIIKFIELIEIMENKYHLLYRIAKQMHDNQLF